MKRLSILITLFLAVLSSSETTPASLTGTWEGRFSSRNFASFPVTLVVNQGVGGRLTGAVNLISPCLRNANLQITIEGSNVVLAGQDPEGDTITFEGSLDEQGTQLTMSYILNGSATGRCETDDGSGTLDKR
jgi:hypothetical protein